jgi:hypothetical protein
MPAQEPPCSQHCQPSAKLPPSACSGKGSLNRSKMTALLPLNVLATECQKPIAWAASGIGFWHTACADVQPPPGPL